MTIIKRILPMGCAFFFLFTTSTWCADKISGSACYTYGDNESLVQAEQMTKTLAIRNAIESYSTFIESTTQIKDLQLSSELISSVSAGQVKGLNVLKRLQSGRKLCYTVEGYVEPKEMDTAIKKYLSADKKTDDARLQENGWVKIVGNFLWKESWEDFHKRHSRPMPDFLKGNVEILKTLYVKIQFLKPCKARTLSVLLSESKSKEEWDKYFGIGLYIVAVSPSDSDSERKDARDRLLKLYPDADKILEEYYMFPKYACDYRNNIFVSYYNDLGTEIKTEKKFPVVFGDEWENGKRKLEMLPGEETYVTFSDVPDNAASWKVWVPK